MMSRAIQTNDESRGPTVDRDPNNRTGEHRTVQSQDSLRVPRVGQSVGVRGSNSPKVICFKCNRPGHISRFCSKTKPSPTSSPKVSNSKKRGNKGKISRRLSSPPRRGSSPVRASRQALGHVSSGNKVLQTIGNTTSVCPFLMLELRRSQLRALVNSGSARSIISSRVCEDLENQGLLKGSEEFSIVCWTASREILPISRIVSFKFKIEGFSWVWSFLVSPALGVDCIIGANFIFKSCLLYTSRCV